MFSLILTIIYRDLTGRNPGHSTVNVIDGFDSAYAAIKAGEIWEGNMPKRDSFTYTWVFVNKGLKVGEKY
jgi:hypothetical protein